MENALEELPIVERDPWLRTYESALRSRYDLYRRRRDEIGQGGDSLRDYANGYLYYGFQYDPALKGWHFREWLPGAEDVYLFGDFNGWQRTELRLDKDAQGVWSIFLPEAMYGHRLRHGSLYKIHVHGRNGWLDRIPAYATRVVQDERTKDFTVPSTGRTTRSTSPAMTNCSSTKPTWAWRRNGPAWAPTANSPTGFCPSLRATATTPCS